MNAGDIYLVHADGGGLEQLTHDCLSADPSWSPDGREIALTSLRDGVPSVDVMDADGSNLRQISPAGLAAWQPAWSRTGRIAFVVDSPAAARGIWTVAPDGSGASHITGYGQRPEWSADGSHITFTDLLHSDSLSRPRIATMLPDGSNVTTIAYGWGPAYSPDGKQLAWISQDSAVSWVGWITVASADGSSPTQVASPNLGFGDVELAWSPDSTQLAYQSGASGSNQEIWAISAAGGTPTRLTTHAALDLDPDWRPVIPSTGLMIKQIAFPQRACATRPAAIRVALTDDQRRPLTAATVVIRGGAAPARASSNSAGLAATTVRTAKHHHGRLTLTVTATAPGRAQISRRVSLPRC